jgi:hypothetical protein
MAGIMRRALNRIGLATSGQVREMTDLMLAQRNKAMGHSSGVPQTVGGIGNQFTYEENTKLRGSTKWATLDEMENDPHVKGSLRTNTTTLLGAMWDIQAASEDPRDELIRDFVASNLLRESNDNFGREYWVSTSWKQRLFEILQMLRDGFSMFGVTMRRQGRFVVYDTLKWLEPSSVDPYGWEMDADDRIINVKRTYQNSVGRYVFDEDLPVEQIALYVWELKGARFEGRPMIRSMYGPWFRKDFVERISAIYAQKIGAPIPVGLYPAGMDATQRSAFEDFVQTMTGMSPAEAWGSFPFKGDEKPEFHYLGAEHDAEHGLTKIADHNNQEIGHAGGTSSEVLGETQSGSRALGESKGDREMLHVEAVAGWVAETESHGSGNVQGLIERLVDLNFPNVKAYPELVCSKIDRNAGKDTLAHVPALYSAGIIPNVPEARRQLTERVGLNLPDDAYEVEEPPSQPEPADTEEAPQAGSPRGETESEGGSEPMAASLALESADDFRARIAPLLEPAGRAPIGAGFRPPTVLEVRVVALVEVNESFRIGERDTLNVLRDSRAAMVRELFTRLRAGKITTRNLESQRRSAFRGRKRWEGSLQRVFSSVARVGAGHVDDEIGRQGASDAAA